ncbi:MAG: ATP-dependent helicase [SAR324 cluster bacterium]|nr:ATP-dependent helicase [SAR324 cluster bacterium]
MNDPFSLSVPLNPDQLRIVEHLEGPALVIAGAGSGKTRVITERVAHLIRTGTPASSILLLTFTNKAAKEMSLRAARQQGVDQEKQKILNGTFHSMASRFLRGYAKLIRYENHFSILDASDSRDLIKASIAEVVGKPGRHFPKASVLSNVYSLAFNRQCNAESIRAQPYVQRTFNLEDLLLKDYPHLEEHSEALLAILKRYRQKKRVCQSMDFDDLLENWLELLLGHGKGLTLKQQLNYILVDEYQDTNQVQAQILHELSKPHQNLMVVGDDAQSIYSWRGADFQNILKFPEQMKAKIYHLEQNYRSSPEILETANQSINHNTQQFEKHLFSELPSGAKPVVHQLWDPQDEAETVLSRLLELRDEGLSLDEMSVLYRNHIQSAVLQVVLTHAGIPFIVHSGVKFFEQAHIKDVTAFLKVIYNPLDEIAWMRLLRMLPGIGNTTANRIFRIFREQQAVRLTQENLELQKTIPARSREEWNLLTDCLRILIKDEITPSEMIALVYRDFYREVMYGEFENASLRENDIHYLQEFSGNYRSLDGFLNELSLVGSTIVTDQEAEAKEQEMLTLTTIHQAKGLEWDAVFIIGLTEGLFPHQRSLDTLEMLEEERRLFYVAMTRTRRHLAIYAPMISSGYNSGLQGRSRFIGELPENCVLEEIHTRDDYSYSEPRAVSRFYF